MTQESKGPRSSVHQHYDESPFPDVPLETPVENLLDGVFLSSMVNAFYVRDQVVVDPAGKWILDVGCGSGFTSLKLAHANPGANIVGIDMSAASIDLARDRLRLHGFERAEFHTMRVEDLPGLGRKFDYVNCDETLYFLPDPLAGLAAMKAVLHPRGAIRVNVHDLFQRELYFRGQRLFKTLGRMDGCTLDVAVKTVRSVMESLRDTAELKSRCWDQIRGSDAGVVENFLLHGDRGFTVPETFALLREAGLEFIRMVNWLSWDLRSLFQDPSRVPEEIERVLSSGSEEEQLHLHEMLNAVNRLIDLWCGHAGVERVYRPPSTWTPEDWAKVRATVHPVLRTAAFRNALEDSSKYSTPLIASSFLKVTSPTEITLYPNATNCMLLLWERPLRFEELVQEWLRVKPVDVVRGEPLQPSAARTELRRVLISLEEILFVMLEKRSGP